MPQRFYDIDARYAGAVDDVSGSDRPLIHDKAAGFLQQSLGKPSR